MNISLLRTFHMEDSQAVNLSSSEPCLFVNNRETPPQPTSRKAAEDLERLTCQNGSFGRNSSLLAVAAQQTYTPWVGTGRVFVVRSSSVIMLSPIVTIFGTGKLLRRGKVKLIDRSMTHRPTPRPLYQIRWRISRNQWPVLKHNVFLMYEYVSFNNLPA